MRATSAAMKQCTARAAGCAGPSPLAACFHDLHAPLCCQQAHARMHPSTLPPVRHTAGSSLQTTAWFTWWRTRV